MDKEEWNEISGNYYDEILSPLRDSTENPLLEDLDKLQGRVIDLGCGLGELESELSRRFEKVVGVDFSEEMVSKAREKNEKLENVEFFVKDISNLKEFKEKFDVAVAVNSIISPELEKVDKIFREVLGVLRRGGVFIGVFPAMEVYIYQAMLLSQRKSEAEARKLINDKEHDFLLGLTNFEGKQKNYYRFELLWRLEKAGFKNVGIERVKYSWSKFREAGQFYFPNQMEPWDWYVWCEK